MNNPFKGCIIRLEEYMLFANSYTNIANSDSTVHRHPDLHSTGLRQSFLVLPLRVALDGYFRFLSSSRAFHLSTGDPLATSLQPILRSHFLAFPLTPPQDFRLCSRTQNFWGC